MLPDDLLFEVFLLLPATTLVQHKLVCRQWWAVITSPLFVCTHHDRAMSQHPGILVSWFSRSKMIKNDEYIEPAYGAGCSYTFSTLPKAPERFQLPTTSCRGLVCYQDTMRPNIVVANPITCDYLHLPPIPIQALWCDQLPRIGFDCVAGTYKVVVRIQNLWSLLVITLGDQSWRWVEFPAPQSRCYFEPFLPMYDRKSFLLFDVVSETFKCWKKVNANELLDATHRPTPRYMTIEPVCICSWSELHLHRCNLKEKVVDNRRTIFCCIQVDLSWWPGWPVRRDWDCCGLWNSLWQGHVMWDSLQQRRREDEWYYGPSSARMKRSILNDDIFINSRLHHASLISPKEIGRLRAQQLEIDNPRLNHASPISQKRSPR